MHADRNTTYGKDIIASERAGLRITKYTIDKVEQTADTAIVTVTASTTKDPEPRTESTSVIKEGGSWKVCYSKLSEISSAPTVPSGSVSLPPSVPSSVIPSMPTDLPSMPTNLPSSLGKLCSAAGNSPLTVATTYVYAAATGLASVAQSCVYDGSVPQSVAEQLAGKEVTPDYGSMNSASGPYLFTAGAQKVTVTVTKESDGSFYVTAVTVS